MVTKSLTVIAPGKTLARRNTDTPVKLMDAGPALVREQLSDKVVQHFVVAESCADAYGDVQWLHRIVDWKSPHQGDYAEQAKAHYRSALPRAASADDAANFLYDLRHPYVPITRAQARAMLHVLFVSMASGKRRQDEAAMAKLAECVDIFSPANNVLGRVLDLWEPVAMHPVTLALAIKRLRASKTFEPSEAELREALAKVEKESRRLERNIREWVRRLQATDEVMFKADPEDWRAAHVAADYEAITCMSHESDDDAYLDALEFSVRRGVRRLRQPAPGQAGEANAQTDKREGAPKWQRRAAAMTTPIDERASGKWHSVFRKIESHTARLAKLIRFVTHDELAAYVLARYDEGHRIDVGGVSQFLDDVWQLTQEPIDERDARCQVCGRHCDQCEGKRRKRSDSHYCSAKCRQKAYRRRVTDRRAPLDRKRNDDADALQLHEQTAQPSVT